MGRLVTIVRPDGSKLQASEEDAAQLQAYGYKEEGIEDKATQAYAAAEDKYWSSPGQKVKTAIEGLGSGMTLGGSDKLLELATDEGITGDDWRSRAEYNPGTRLGSELVGAIAPSFFSGGTLTPAGALTEGAGLATKGIGSAVTRGAARGALEGAGFGLGAEISHSALTGDPLTVEGTLAGMGWGSLWGGGIGALGGKLESAILKKSAVEADAAKTIGLMDEHFGALKTDIREAGQKAESAFKAVGDEIEVTTGRAEAALKEAKAIRDRAFSEPWTENIGLARVEKKAAVEAYNEMKTAFSKKDWESYAAASEKFEQKIDSLNEVANAYSYDGAAPVGKFARFQNTTAASASVDALNQIKELGAVSGVLKSFAETPAGLANMGSNKFEKTAGALETFLKHPAAELKGTQEAIAASIAKMAESVGVATDGPPVAQLRGVWENMRAAKSAKGVDTANKMTEGKMPWMSKMAAEAGGAAISNATKSGWMGYRVGHSVISGLLGVKGAVLGAIGKSVESWAPRAQKALRYTAAQGEPLAVRLDGTMDLRDRKKSQLELMKDRMREINEAAPTIRDTLYKQLAPLDAHFPDYAAALHEQAVNQFTFLYNKMPRDPGNAFNRLESLWNPPPQEVAKFGRYLEIFHNPMKVVTDALSGKRVTPEAAEGLSNMWPALFNHMRMALIQRFSDPALLNKMQYDDQVQMSLLTGLRMHSTMRPEFIAQQQQMYTERNQPLEMPPQPGAPGSAGGRPNTDSPYATPAQRSTDR